MREFKCVQNLNFTKLVISLLDLDELITDGVDDCTEFSSPNVTLRVADKVDDGQDDFQEALRRSLDPYFDVCDVGMTKAERESYSKLLEKFTESGAVTHATLDIKPSNKNKIKEKSVC